MDETRCIPLHKSDFAAAENAAELGFPAINSILPQLLGWLQDGNWPVAAKIAALLAKAGPEIAPHISIVLNSDDDTWKYWILAMLGPHLDQSVWKLIEPDVTRLSRAPTEGEIEEEVDVEASKLLALRSNPDR